jgi:hypothetical protein
MVQRVHHTVKEIFLENGKLNRFIVARIYSRKHLTNMRTAKKRKRNKRWEEVVTSAMNCLRRNGVRFTCRIQPFKYGY